MANQIYVDPGTSDEKVPVKTRTSAGVDWPVSLLAYGAAGSEQIVDSTHGLPMQLQSGHGLATQATLAELVETVATAAAQASALTVLQAIRDRLPSSLTGGRLAADVSGTDLDIRNLSSVTDSVAVGGSLPAGTNSIGQVTCNAGANLNTSALATQATLASVDGKITACNTNSVTIASQPALSSTADAVTAKLATDSIQNGTAALTPKFAAISASSSGNNTLVAAVASKKVRVIGLWLLAAGSVSVKVQSGASGTDLTGSVPLVANTGFVLPFNPVGWVESASGVLLNLNLSTAVTVAGSLVYVEV